MTQLKIMAAQINPSRGVLDIAGNTKKIAEIWKQADEQGVDLIVTPEQSLTGYPLEDMATQPDVLHYSQVALEQLVEFSNTRESALMVGMPEIEDGKIYNTVYVIEHGIITGKVRKHDLPNDDVFDEKRIYTSSDDIKPIDFRGHKLGVLICEDLWHVEVAESLARQGAEALIVPNASPWFKGKENLRVEHVMKPRIQETGLPILYVNQVGGVDELVFDGHSMAMNADGNLAYVAKGFVETLDVVELTLGAEAKFTQAEVHPFHEELESVWQALVLGTRDYVQKNGFKKVLLGNSGGIDSGVVAAIAVDALGAENVGLYKLPSAFTQEDSNSDADITARLLGADIEMIDIWPAYETIVSGLQGHFQTNRDDATLANIQSRIRGVLLMALSNRNDAMLLSTGNQSEMAVGYATIYGDMNGGFNPLKNVDKLLVRELAIWRNQNNPENCFGPAGPVISENTITKKAKAELSADNPVDEDVLPEYPVLVDISNRYIQENQSIQQIREDTGYDDQDIEDVIVRTDIAEFKRRQSCPGIKVSKRDFGRGYRVPITRLNTIRMINSVNQLKL